MDMVIKNGTVVTASESYRADVGIKDGKIVAIAATLPEEGEVIDATGHYVCPGAVETHTHIDAPMHGSRTADDWYTATVSAACGGVTSVVDFPNQVEGQTVRDIINDWNAKAEEHSVIDYSFSPAIHELNDRVWSEIPELIEEGYPTYKIFLTYDWRQGDYQITRMLDLLKDHGGMLCVHCEDGWAIDYLVEKAMKEGRTTPPYHETTRPDLMESTEVERMAVLSEVIGAPVFIVHTSAGKAVERIHEAKGRGTMVYAETTPHFLSFTKEVYKKEPAEASKFVVTPPFREAEDIEALWRGLRNGTISTVGSDHCAFYLKAKAVGLNDFPHIPHGAPGVETRVPIVFSSGVSEGRITVNKFVEVIATNPAKLFGMYPEKGVIGIGSDADIMIIDPEKEVTMSNDILHSNADYTPFEGFKLKGYPITTISRGEVLWQDGQFKGTKGRGKLMKRTRFQRLVD